MALNILKNRNNGIDGKTVTIFEVDFPEIISEKASTILSSSVCRSALLSSEQLESPRSSFNLPGTEGGLRVGGLILLPADLRDGEEVKTALHRGSFDSSLPTLIISECVLVYISKSDVKTLVRTIADMVQEAAWVTYDMVNPDDSFGKMMVKDGSVTFIYVD